jgi:hypothetical protein
MISYFLDVRWRLFKFGCGQLLAKLWWSIEGIASPPEVIGVMVPINLIELLRRHARYSAASHFGVPSWYPATWLNADSYLDEADNPRGDGNAAITEPLRSSQSFSDARPPCLPAPRFQSFATGNERLTTRS